MTMKTLSMASPTTISFTVTIDSWLNARSTLISRSAVTGNPSRWCCCGSCSIEEVVYDVVEASGSVNENLICLRATTSLVATSRAFHTTPYVPSLTMASRS
jgi:hypothetical protein